MDLKKKPVGILKFEYLVNNKKGKLWFNSDVCMCQVDKGQLCSTLTQTGIILEEENFKLRRCHH